MSKYKSEMSQVSHPYYSTLFMESILRDFIDCRNTYVADYGCGLGAQTIYLASKFPLSQFVGFDYNEEKIFTARDIASKVNVKNVTFETSNLIYPQDSNERLSLPKGAISIQTLCCFRSFEPFFESILTSDPEWIVINSLFWEGDLDVLIHIRDDESAYEDTNPDGDFNIFSTNKIRDFLGQRGYSADFVPFYPPKSISGPGSGRRGTYTMSTDLHPRTQFSGPVHLPWQFLKASKN